MNTTNQITRQDVGFFRTLSRQTNALDQYQQIATKSAIYPGQSTVLGLAYVALKLNSEAGELAGHFGTAMRDENLISLEHNGEHYVSGTRMPLTPERRERIVNEIGDLLWYLSAACNELGISLSEAAAENLTKLCDRTERNVLRGSGDTR